MKKKLISVQYLGFTSMDLRFSSAMLPWLLTEIKNLNARDKISLSVSGGLVKAYNENFEQIFSHRLASIIRCCHVPNCMDEFFYIVKLDKLLHCYLFRAFNTDDVTELFKQMKEPSPEVSQVTGGLGTTAGDQSGAASVTKNVTFQRDDNVPWDKTSSSSFKGISNLTASQQEQAGPSQLVKTVSNASNLVLSSLSADLSPSTSHFFEVLYIGKVKVSNRKIPDTLIDDALTKFQQFEVEKAKAAQIRRNSLLLGQNQKGSFDSSENGSLDSVKESVEPKSAPTSPMIPDRKHKSDDNDDGFDSFTKERFKFNSTIKKPIPSALEPSVLILNVSQTKNNLSTLAEDDRESQKIDDCISDTASSITQFCQASILKDKIAMDDQSFDKFNDPLSNTSYNGNQEINKSNFVINDDLGLIKSAINVRNASIKEHDSMSIDTNKEIVDKFEPNNGIKDKSITDKEAEDKINTNKEIVDKFNINKDKFDVNVEMKENNNTVKDGKIQIKEADDSDVDIKVIKSEDIASKSKLLVRSKTGLGDLEQIKKAKPENKPFLRDRSASIGTLNLNKTPIAQLIGEQNRTMLFQVGKAELRLISTDRKQVLLLKLFRDIASCAIGRASREHFGFVCREANSEAYVCYVFKCESDVVAGEVITAIRLAFNAHADEVKRTREKSPNSSCDHCPMMWYHRLCQDIEGMSEKRTHAFILRRIEQLPSDEQEQIITKYQGGTNHIYEIGEHNSFLMVLLRAHCEAKQTRHVHDTMENRSEFLNQYLGSGTIFMKAKRSLSSGFDQLLKRKASKDDIHIHSLPIKKETTPQPQQDTPVQDVPNISVTQENGYAARSASSVVPVKITEVIPEESRDIDANTGNSPMLEIFLQVGDTKPSDSGDGRCKQEQATWRQAIYQSVTQQEQGEDIRTTDLLNIHATDKCQDRRSGAELRELWKLAINQTILLVRMEKENARIRECEESRCVRRIKLEYPSLCSGLEADTGSVWDAVLTQTQSASAPAARLDTHLLTQAVRQGVPRTYRGRVWYFLAEQACLRSPPPGAKAFPNYYIPYNTLLSGLTKYQHAILIDLGRTFPQHTYFSSALGPGQLALYNILKAYSLLDPEVGYCQGLSFVAGLLLLHMDEAEAFVLLRHLMFRRGLRKQYLPNMSALQVQLYQLSRLVRDTDPALHTLLERLDVNVGLYASPWMLTLFTSQFPLDFAARVFDLIFLDSFESVFAVSLALLLVHRDGLMMCTSCEEAAEYLKHKLPDVDKHVYERVFKKVFSMDLSRQLKDYAVEYGVLKEQMPKILQLEDLRNKNEKHERDNQRLLSELDDAMESISNYQSTQSRLENQIKSLECQLSLLSRFTTTHCKQDLPPDIKRICQTYSKKVGFGSKITILKNQDDEEDPKSKSILKSGKSTPNLLTKLTKEDLLQLKSNMAEVEKRKSSLQKSVSVSSGLIATAIRSDLRSDANANVIRDTLRDIGKKNSGFFASSHEQIRQERMNTQQANQDFHENLRRLNEKLYPNRSYKEDLPIYQSKKSLSLNVTPSKDDRKGDSGFVTPMSPDDRNDSSSVISHPLSDCDVEIKFDGTSTKLRCLNSVK